MSDLSNYSENFIAGEIATEVASVALYSVARNKEDGTGGTELTGNGYARQSMTGSATGSVVSNAAQVQFESTGSAWSEAVQLVVVDGADNILWSDTVSYTVGALQTLTFAAGDINCSFD